MSIHPSYNFTFPSTKDQQASKIAIVSNSSWYTYNFRLGLLTRLRNNGIKVYVIAPQDHYSTKLMAEGFHFIPISAEVYGTNPFRELQVIRFLSEVYKKEKFDFILHYTAKPNIYGSLAAYWNRIPSIAITTGLGLLRDEKKGIARKIVKSLYRLVGKLSREVWFLNKDDQQYFLKNRMVREAKTFILPSEGVDIRWYQPSYPINKKGKPIIQFLYAGRIVKSKGIREYYQAAQYFKDQGTNVKFKMIGFVVPDHPDGVSYNTIQDWNRKGVVQYLGETEDIRPFIEEADCIVLPSYFGEGVPRILLEAASMGKPIVTTDFVGCREVVDDGLNGFLCQPKNTTDLIQKLANFVALSPSERARMGLAGRRKILEQFDEEIIIKHYLTAISRYITMPNRGVTRKERSISQETSKAF